MFAHVPAPFPRGDFRGGKERGALLVRMAVNEIEDAVRTRPGPVDEVGPGDGALRGDARAQLAKCQLLQIGELAPLHHARRQAGVHAVDADHNDFLAGTPGGPLAAAQPVTAGADGHRGGRATEGGRRLRKFLRSCFRFDDSAIIQPLQECHFSGGSSWVISPTDSGLPSM